MTSPAQIPQVVGLVGPVSLGARILLGEHQRMIKLLRTDCKRVLMAINGGTGIQSNFALAST